jgi:hypothetical protein
MDYRTVPPPTWATATPSEWEREANHARAMLRNATHYAPDLVAMFRAWATAWDERNAAWSACVRDVEAFGREAVKASADGRQADARRLFHRAVQAEGDARDVCAVTYPCFLETIPNHE